MITSFSSNWIMLLLLCTSAPLFFLLWSVWSWFETGKVWSGGLGIGGLWHNTSLANYCLFAFLGAVPPVSSGKCFACLRVQHVICLPMYSSPECSNYMRIWWWIRNHNGISLPQQMCAISFPLCSLYPCIPSFILDLIIYQPCKEV